MGSRRFLCQSEVLAGRVYDLRCDIRTVCVTDAVVIFELFLFTEFVLNVSVVIRGAPIEDFTDIPITDILSRIEADTDNR